MFRISTETCFSKQCEKHLFFTCVSQTRENQVKIFPVQLHVLNYQITHTNYIICKPKSNEWYQQRNREKITRNAVKYMMNYFKAFDINLEQCVIDACIFFFSGTSTYPHDFDRYTTHNVTVTEGRQAILPCHVDSNELQVSKQSYLLGFTQISLFLFWLQLN